MEQIKISLNSSDWLKKLKANKNTLKKVVGRKLAARVLKTWIEDFVDEDTGEVVSIERNEVLLERDHTLTAEDVDVIIDSGVKSIILHREDINIADYHIIFNTLKKILLTLKKKRLSISIASCEILKHLMNETARGIIEKLFFSEKRYDLGEVGRYRINRKLGLDLQLRSTRINQGRYHRDR